MRWLRRGMKSSPKHIFLSPKKRKRKKKKTKKTTPGRVPGWGSGLRGQGLPTPRGGEGGERSAAPASPLLLARQRTRTTTIFPARAHRVHAPLRPRRLVRGLVNKSQAANGRTVHEGCTSLRASTRVVLLARQLYKGVSGSRVDTLFL